MITDSSFLSRYSTAAFDAAGNGGMIYVTLFVALMGMSDGSQILMARRIGEKKEKSCMIVKVNLPLAGTPGNAPRTEMTQVPRRKEFMHVKCGKIM